MAETVESFHPPDAAQRNGKPISRRACAIGLTSPMRRCAKTSGRCEACRLGREAEEPFAQMEPAGVAVPGAINKIAGEFAVGRRGRRMWYGKDQLGCDLLQRILGIRETELLAKQGGLGRVAIGGREGRKTEVSRVDEGLGFLNE